MSAQRGELLYEGKAKKLFATDKPDLLLQVFKDEATAFDGAKKGIIADKGKLNCAISSRIFRMLEGAGVRTHFVERTGEREMLVRKVRIVPIEVVVRNRVAGSLSKRYGIPEGTPLAAPLQEFFLKSDPLHDPLVTEQAILAFGWATAAEIARLRAEALKVNDILRGFFDRRGIELVDFKLEFGVAQGGPLDGQILLADEITPDGCRLWDKKTQEKMDKDRFRRDLGKVEEAYQEVAQRVLGDAPGDS
ncbi:MAG: phosphoribosylaminoimidazolesuccinocarboxamide synthase [Candidatus Methylomirabilis sp.]|nr:phosphoribosylaminoimidazolesuccinocarboxamide synthase [Deltaproteobacteria bacterium]